MSDEAIQALVRQWRMTQDPNDAVRFAAAVSRAKTGSAFGMVTAFDECQPPCVTVVERAPAEP